MRTSCNLLFSRLHLSVSQSLSADRIQFTQMRKEARKLKITTNIRRQVNVACIHIPDSLLTSIHFGLTASEYRFRRQCTYSSCLWFDRRWLWFSDRRETREWTASRGFGIVESRTVRAGSLCSALRFLSFSIDGISFRIRKTTRNIDANKNAPENKLRSLIELAFTIWMKRVKLHRPISDAFDHNYRARETSTQWNGRTVRDQMLVWIERFIIHECCGSHCVPFQQVSNQRNNSKVNSEKAKKQRKKTKNASIQ